MEIPVEVMSEEDVTGKWAKSLRKSLGMSQPAFWEPVGVSQPSASRYERERDTIAAEPVRILLFTRYVAGLEIDAKSKAGIRKLKRLALLQRQDVKRAKREPETAPSEG